MSSALADTSDQRVESEDTLVCQRWQLFRRIRMEAIRMRSLIPTLPLIVCLIAGCASLEDQHYRNINRMRAANAWWKAKSNLPKNCRDSDYARGWKDGYFDVATGGCGEAPAVPPPAYWSPRFQDSNGRCDVNQYFTGWQSGVICAEKDGRGNFHDIPIRAGAPVIECPSDCGPNGACSGPAFTVADSGGEILR